MPLRAVGAPLDRWRFAFPLCVLLTLLLLGNTVAVHAQEDPCNAKITGITSGFGIVSGVQSSFEAAVSHNGVGALEWTFRGSTSSTTTILGNPQGIILNVACLVSPAELVVRGSKCGGWGQPVTHSVTPPDTQPKISAVAGYGNTEPQSVTVFYSFPNSTDRRVKAFRKDDIQPAFHQTGIGGTVPDGQFGIEFSVADEGLVVVKAWSCERMTSDTVELKGKDCECPDKECPELPKCAGDPVNTISGNMRYRETDPLPGSAFLQFSRTYDSMTSHSGFFGPRWFSMLDARLYFQHDDIDDSVYVWLIDENHHEVVFEGINGVFRQIGPGGPGKGFLARQPDGTWLHRDGDRRLSRTFDANGRVLTYREAATGREVGITWDGAVPVRVADSWGNWSLAIATNQGRITSVALESQPSIALTYEYTNGHLTTVKSANDVWRTYEYEGNQRLGSIRDGLGNLIESHVYDDRGRALTSYGPSAEIALIETHVPLGNGERGAKVHYANGRVETRRQQAVRGQWRTSEIDGGCASCGSSDVAAAYRDHPTGRTVYTQSAEGYITFKRYDTTGTRVVQLLTALRPPGCNPATDPLHCRLSSQALGDLSSTSFSSATMETRYEYNDANWPNRATKTTTLSAAKADGKVIESLTLHPNSGQVLSRSVTGWTGDPLRQETRVTTTALYSGTEGAAFDPGGAFSAAWLSLPQPRFLQKSVDGPLSGTADTTSFVYYPIDDVVPAAWRGHLAATKNAAGHITRFEDYDAFGNARTAVDANGVVQTFTFDSMGRRLTATTKGVAGCDTVADPLCATDATTTWIYSGAGPLSMEQRPGGGITKYEYDQRTRVKSISRGPSAGDLRERIEYEYDVATGKRQFEKYLSRVGQTWVEKRQVEYSYDAFEQLSDVISGGTSASYEYEYGHLSAQRDENHGVFNTFYEYDPASRVREVRQKLGTAEVVTGYLYDIHGNVTHVTDPNGNTTEYIYDDFGQLLRQSSPVTGTTTYQYDVAGRLFTSTDANGATTTRTYDALGRLLTSTAVRGSQSESVSYGYDSGPFATGRLTSVTDPAGSATFRYERRGLLNEEVRTLSGTTYRTGYRYDEDGNRTQIHYPSGRVVTYGFDYAGRPSTAMLGTTALVTSASYRPFGPPTTIAFGNGTSRVTDYDDKYRPLTHELRDASGAIASYVYVPDPAGNVLEIDDVLAPAYDRTFIYDDLNRLVNANTGTGLWGTGAFAYDAMGSMTSATLGSGRSATFTYVGTRPRLSSVTENGTARNVAYDPAGNESAVGASAFFYSPRNHLLAESDRRYEYDARGIRVTQSCHGALAIGSNSASYPATASSGAFTVEARCAWNVTTTATWVSLTTPAGQGNGSVQYSFGSNPTTAARTATILVGTQVHTVTQAGAALPAPFRSDFDGDGFGDVLTRDSDTGKLRLLLMKGAAQPAQAVDAGELRRREVLVGTGDFWGDGFVSLVIVDRDDRKVWLRRMNGPTTVSQTLIRDIVSRHWQIVGVGDFNGDRKSDLLLRNDGTRQLSVWLLDGNTVLSDPIVGQPLADWRWLVAAVADFDNDGKADILFRHSGSGQLSLWEMNGTTVRSTGVLSDAPAASTWRVEDAADFDGDGKADVLLRNATTAALEVWRMNGRAVIGKLAVGTVADRRSRVVAFGPYGSDQRADVLLRHSDTAALELRESDGLQLGAPAPVATLSGLRWSVQTPPRFRPATAHSDFGGDGQSDLLLRHSSTNDLAMWELSGRTVLDDRVFAAVVNGDWQITKIGDVTGDRLGDFLLRNVQSRHLALWEMLGRVVLDSQIIGHTDLSVLALGDFNGNGSADLLLRNMTTGQFEAAEIVDHQLDDFWPIGAPIAMNWQLSAVGDFDGDGTDDLILRNSNGSGPQDLNLLTLNGAAAPVVTRIGAVPSPAWQIIGSGDTNGDGMADLILQNGLSVAMWELSGARVLSDEVFVTITHPAWVIRAMGDYNGDRQMDILLRHSSDDRVAMWELNGRQLIDTRAFAQITSPAWVIQPPISSTAASVVSGEPATSLTATEPAASAKPSKPGPPWWTPAALRIPTWLPAFNPNLPTFLRHPGGAATAVPASGAPTWLPPSGPHLAATSDAIVPSPIIQPAFEEPTTPTAVASGIARQHFLYTPELSLLAETETAVSSPAIAYEYVWFGGQPLAQLAASGTPSWYFNDHLGTPILQTDAARTVVWRAEYEPYGRVYAYRTGATKHQPLRFPGQESRDGAEMTYNIFRWYRAGWGRYTQADPLNQPGLSIWNGLRSRLRSMPSFVGQTLVQSPTNDFAYADEDPIRRTDPLGLASQQWVCGMSSITPAPVPSPPLGQKLCLYDVYCFKLLDLMGWNPLTSIYVGAVGMTPKDDCKCPSKCVFTYFGNHPAEEFGQSLFNAVCTK